MQRVPAELDFRAQARLCVGGSPAGRTRMPTDIDIARAATLRPITAIAEAAGIPDEALHPFGKHIAKVDGAFIETRADKPRGRLVLVTAISPTPAGEGKTT